MNGPRDLRELNLALLESCEKPGHALRDRLKWTDVPGKPLLEADSNRERQMREEFYLVVVLVFLKLVSHMDIVTSDVCRDEDKSFKGIKLEKISATLALEQRTLERAVYVIHRAGLMQSTQRAEAKEGGGYRGHTSIRKISIAGILTMLGGSWARRWLELQRKIREQRQAKALEPTPEQLAARALDAVRQKNTRPPPAREDLEARPLSSLLGSPGARYGPKGS